MSEGWRAVILIALVLSPVWAYIINRCFPGKPEEEGREWWRNV